MINLLPSQYKEELLIAETKRLVVVIGFLVLIFFLSLFLILLAIEIYLNSQVDAQKNLLDLQRKEKEGPEVKEMEEKTKTINLKLSKLDNFYQKQIHLSEILEKINSTIPSGIYLTDLSYSKDNSLIFISGFSPNREILVQFKKNLESNFFKVKVPPANWVESANIKFSGINFSISQ